MALIRYSFRTCLLLHKINGLIPAVRQQQSRCIKRWVAPTLFELRRRAKIMGPQEPQPRSGFVEWNYRAELFAFGKRLQEDFELSTLQTAFTTHSYIAKEQQKQRELGIEESDMSMKDNRELAKRGKHLTKEYINAFMSVSLPKVPTEGILAISNYLVSEPTLSLLAMQLGMKDLIFADEYPPSEETLAQSLLAVIGALEHASGVERSLEFVRDFICTQLNQRDLLDLWEIKNPGELLHKICQNQKLQQPEARLIGNCGRNTVLAAYHVGLYSNKQLIGQGFGEDLTIAIETASLNALQLIFGIGDNMRPFNFQLQVKPKNIELSQNI